MDPTTPGYCRKETSISLHTSQCSSIVTESHDPDHLSSTESRDPDHLSSTESHDPDHLSSTESHEPPSMSHNHHMHSSSTTGSHDHYTPTAPDTSSMDTKLHNLNVSTEETLSKLYQEDSIGSTVFSKAWVLSILVRVVRAVSIEHEQDQVQLAHDKNSATEMNRCQPDVNVINKETKSDTCAEKEANENGSDSYHQDQDFAIKNFGNAESGTFPRSEVTSNDSMEGIASSGEDNELELEEELESQLCTLWDASINEDVAKFIHEQHGVDLLLGAANRSQMPRLTEICLGILANMSCIEAICVESVSTTQLVGNILQNLQNTDPGVLCQTTRLIHACLSHETVHPLWLPEISQSVMVKETLLFILGGSTNDDLLASTSELLDLLVNTSESLLELWVDSHLVEALCEAAEQSRYSSFHVTCMLVSTLHTLTTIEEGVASVLSCAELVSSLLSNFLLVVDHMENHSAHMTALIAALSVLLTLVDNESLASPSGIHEAKAKLTDPHVVQALQNLNKESKSFDSEQLPEFSQLTELISKLSDSLNCPTFSDSMVEHDLV